MTEILVGLDDNPAALDARRVRSSASPPPTGATLRVASAYPYDTDPSRASSPDYAALLEGDTRRAARRASSADVAEAVPGPLAGTRAPPGGRADGRRARRRRLLAPRAASAA